MAKKEVLTPDVDEWNLTFMDWFAVQGGKPTVSQENGLTVICHDYPDGKGMVVKSHHDVDYYGLTPMGIGIFHHRTKDFPVALLRKFHGEPCEQQSRKHGGDSYDRKR